MNTIMGVHPQAIINGVTLFVVLHGIRILLTWAHRRFAPKAPSNVADLDARRPDPTVDEHIAFPEDAVLLDLASARARRG
jgi:hypothetical protein